MRRRAALILAGLALPAAARAQGSAPRPRGELWFDPTQLPSFTGTVERYLPNPRGETDALIFREGPQIVFPPDVADAVRQAAPAGRPLVVWGIRARNAPVITMLAFAPASDQPPTVVDRLYWRLGGRLPQERATQLTVSGTVKQPYYAPQGEVAGAILEDGTVVLVPQGTAEGVKDLLKAGATLTAEGMGQAGEGGRALLAGALGESPEALKPIAPPR
ncbi:hypothetical protein [Paracraurococcus lichenis]|uniref:Uncharacterized protein n=1 Tax=Paracraurococcus lichenis TaxID=3064888 RepID=A0ABT9E5B4_9PROT|nr:hypothetical protein [Paracraurococcus sp. LOR1-02]MDO9711180.1 hypothetical protein [Paracraurococcus sp. LOR1-02]